MTFDEWMQHGIAMRWALPVVCAIHDSVPMDEQEEEAFNDGFDPCINVIRVCQPDEFEAIYNNTTAMKWRDQ